MPDNPTSYDRRRPRDRALRVGDAEREAVAGLLREHHVAGRLASDEFQDRLDLCMTAKTHADLDRLIDDLPAPAAVAREPRPRWRPWPLALVPLVIVAIVVSGGRAAWLAVPLLLFFVVRPLVWRRSGYAGGWWCGRPRSSA